MRMYVCLFNKGGIPRLLPYGTDGQRSITLPLGWSNHEMDSMVLEELRTRYPQYITVGTTKRLRGRAKVEENPADVIEVDVPKEGDENPKDEVSRGDDQEAPDKEEKLKKEDQEVTDEDKARFNVAVKESGLSDVKAKALMKEHRPANIDKAIEVLKLYASMEKASVESSGNVDESPKDVEAPKAEHGGGPDTPIDEVPEEEILKEAGDGDGTLPDDDFFEVDGEEK